MAKTGMTRLPFVEGPDLLGAADFGEVGGWGEDGEEDVAVV